MATLLNNIAGMFRNVVPVAPMGQPNPGAASVVPPAGTSLPTTEAAAPNPMDQMAALWQTDPNSAPAVDPLTTPLFNTDPAKIAAAAGKIDLVGQLPPELLAKAMSGQDPAAFAQVLNAVAQRTLATATQLNAATTEQATTRNNERILNALPGRVKQIQLDAMTPENAALNHPASQPFLKLVRSQIQAKNPNMSAQEINRQAESVLAGYASQLATPPQTEQVSQAGGTDWDAWANS